MGDYRQLGLDERKRCFRLRKLFVIKLSEGASDCLRQSYAHMENSSREVSHDFTRD